MTTQKREDFAHVFERRQHWLVLETFLQFAAVLTQISVFSVIAWTLFEGRQDFLKTRLFWSLPAANLVLWTAMFMAREVWKALDKQADHDPKTGLYHSAYFDKVLEKEVRRAGRYKYPLTLCRVDLDEFSSFNQHYGRRQGDMRLQQFADFMKAAIRNTDVLARFENDEFCILLPHTELVKAEKFISRLLAHTQERLDCSFSAGLTAYQTGESKFQFFHRGELALHQARQEGQKKVRCIVSGTDSHAVLSF